MRQISVLLVRLALFACFSTMAHAQMAELLPAVAQPDSNVVRTPGGISDEMKRLVNKLDSVLLYGVGRVSILHIGGSHVQADMYTDVIRQNMDSLNNGLTPPRGFLFPYTAARTNNPLNYRVKYGGVWSRNRCALRQYTPALGVGGIAISTQDTSAWFSVLMNTGQDKRWQTNDVRLLCRSQRGLLRPTVVLGDTLTIEGTRTESGYDFRLPKATDEFKVGIAADKRFDGANDTLVVTGLLPDNGCDGIVYHTIGVNGASVPNYLSCSLFQKELKEMAPDLVVFAIGINDATSDSFTKENFKNNYASLIREIRAVSPHCALLFITNNDSSIRRRRRAPRVVNTNGPVAREAFYEMAEEWGGGLWDLFEVMGGLGSMGEWQKKGLAQKDRVHFSRAGYVLIGNMFFRAFLDFYLDQDSYLE